MTADEARLVEGKFGKLTGIDRKAGYPHTLYGTIVKVDSYWLLFETTGEVLLLFSLRKATFEPVARKCKLYYLRHNHLTNSLKKLTKDLTGKIN